MLPALRRACGHPALPLRRWNLAPGLNNAVRNLGTYSARASARTRPMKRATKAAIFGTTAAATLLSSLWLAEVVYLDAPPLEDTRADPATSIEFPKTLVVQSKSHLPSFQLVGLGVRTVSFLGIKVYSVGFYADLGNPNLRIPATASPEEKIDHIVRNTACMLRIIPTRNTSYTHLRDGFVRALQARMNFFKKRGQITPEEELQVASPIRTLKSIFPNAAINKGQPLDIILTAPPNSEERKQFLKLTGKEPQRTLIFRDLGAVQGDWVAREFILGYFEGDGLSPPLKKDVIENLASLTR